MIAEISKYKCFVDTNVIVYASDRNELNKMECARNYLGKLADLGNGVLSTQVMQEYYVTATRKIGIDALKAKHLIEGLSCYQIVQITQDLICKAIDVAILNTLSFWDSLIVSAASLANCDLLITEDLQHNQMINGIRVFDPFQG